MELTMQIAKHIRETWFGGNWTGVTLKETLANVTWQQATTQVYSLHTIAKLVYHINYFVSAVMPVLEGDILNAHDKFSFDLPQLTSQQDWEKLLDTTFTNAEKFAVMVEQLPEKKLWEDFSNNKYGNYYRNIHGIIEHTNYHLGQINLIKKILLQADK